MKRPLPNCEAAGLKEEGEELPQDGDGGRRRFGGRGADGAGAMSDASGAQRKSMP
jgi:hypothetical protein